jgi:hypothetical protein
MDFLLFFIAIRLLKRDCRLAPTTQRRDARALASFGRIGKQGRLQPNFRAPLQYMDAAENLSERIFKISGPLKWLTFAIRVPRAAVRRLIRQYRLSPHPRMACARGSLHHHNLLWSQNDFQVS